MIRIVSRAMPRHLMLAFVVGVHMEAPHGIHLNALELATFGQIVLNKGR